MIRVSTKTHFVLYAYTYPDKIKLAKANLKLKKKEKTKLSIKIGDTIQGVDKKKSVEECAWLRMNQQGDANESQKKILFKAWFIEKTSYFRRDKDLHRVLKQRGMQPKDEYDGKGCEWFNISYDGTKESSIKEIEEFITRVQKKNPREILRLEPLQEKKLNQCLLLIDQFIQEGRSSEICNIIANLCPRFGKTLWALRLFQELNKKYGNNLLLLPAYALSSHSSFEKEIDKYEDFRNIRFIDIYEENYDLKMEDTLNSGDLAVVSISSHIDEAKIERYLKPIKDYDDDKKFVFIDEGDLGIWKEHGRKVFKYLFK